MHNTEQNILWLQSKLQRRRHVGQQQKVSVSSVPEIS